MNGAVGLLVSAASCICGGVAAGGLSWRWLRAKRRKSLHERGLAAHGVGIGRGRLNWKGDVNALVLDYAAQLNRRIYSGLTEPLSPGVRSRRASTTRSGRWYRDHAHSAGCAKRVSVSAFCEARFRLAAAGLISGALIGCVLSKELMVILGFVGFLAGRALPMRAVREVRRERALEAEQYLSEMLEVVSLGLRSGLTFDRSFALYGYHFDNSLAQSSLKAYRKWSMGLTTRDDALREFSDSYDCDQLSHVVDSVIRGLRFGTALSDSLEEAATQSRESFRSKLGERVAKAPVKMMLPTGTLILPAMLLLVMGPILLELASGF